jgi:hypothetical protein
MNEANSKMATQVETFGFGLALTFLRDGARVARHGWNGKGMFLLMAGGYSVKVEDLRHGGPITPAFLASRGLDEMYIQPHIDMWTAQNQYQTGWVASQSDMQATDWYIVDKI